MELTGTRQPNVRDWREFHRVNDEYWAREVTATTGFDPTWQTKIQITASDVRAMRLLAGIADDEPSDSVLTLQGAHMKLGQYLLVSAKPKGCLSLGVFKGSARRFKKIWSVDSDPDGEICQQDNCPTPRISVDEKHKISIFVLSRSNPALPVCDRFSLATYKPEHNSYAVELHRTGTSKCWSDAYYAGLNSACKKAAGEGKTLVIVQVLPALGSRYALVLQRNGTKVEVLQMNWRREDEVAAVFTTMKNATAVECFEHAEAVPISVVKLGVAAETARNLAEELRNLDLRSDRCSRGPDQTCRVWFDGRSFNVQVSDQAAIQITDVKGLRGYSSENEELSAWIYRLLAETQALHGP